MLALSGSVKSHLGKWAVRHIYVIDWNIQGREVLPRINSSRYRLPSVVGCLKTTGPVLSVLS